MSVDKYLNQLIDDKQVLVDALVDKGVEASSDETFTSLAPKVNDIKGGKYAPRCISFYEYGGTELDDELSNLNTSNMTSMTRMFYRCTKLPKLYLSNFNTSNVVSLYSMFYYCESLHTLDLSSFDTSNVTTLEDTFNYCRSLCSLNVSSFNTSKVKSFASTFSGCEQLETLNIANFNFEACDDNSGILSSCFKLQNLTFGTNLGKGYTSKSANTYKYRLSLSSSSSLTHDSLMSVINNLYDLNLTYKVASGGTLYTQQLMIGSTNLAKLTAEEIAIATNKGWTVS